MQPDRWALVGRAAEHAAIVLALEADPPDNIVIVGPAGAGRTRLAREALAVAQGQGRHIRWAAGTGAAAHVPLAALAHLLPPVDTTVAPLALLQRAAQAIAGDAVGHPAVLAVDDVHLLDRLSVTLLHQLAVSRTVTLVLTVLTDHTATDPAAPLWKDGLAARLELRPLGRAEVETLTAQALQGHVDSRTGDRLWKLTQGNPLYLRELLDDGVASQQLQAVEGLWRWDGAMVPSQRLAEIVLGQLGRLDRAEWSALEVLAAAELLHVQHLVDVAGAEAVASLQRRGLITDVTGWPGAVRATNPLHAEVIRSRAPQAALRAIRRRLSEDGRVLPPEEQEGRRAAMLLDGGAAPPDGSLLAAAAQRANALLDHRVAERLARASTEAGGGASAHLAWAEALRWQGFPARSVGLTADAERLVASDDELARLAASRALTLLCGLGQPEDADLTLKDAGAAVSTEGGRAVLAATGAMMAFLAGDPRRALREAGELLASGSSGGGARPLAAAALAAGLAVTGETKRSLEAAVAGWAALDEASDATEVGFVRLALTQAEILALRYGGLIDELQRRSVELHQQNLGGPEWAGDAVAALHRGWALLAGGQLAPAVRWLIEARAGLTHRDPVGLLALATSLLGTSKAMAGDASGAAQILADGGSAHRTAVRVFEPVHYMAHAWLAAVEGRTADAGELAFAAATSAREQGQWAVEADMLHGALRFGRRGEILGRLRELCDQLDSPVVELCYEHAKAAWAPTGAALDRVSRGFEEMRALLQAAEAATEAAAAHQRVGDRRAASVSTARAATLARDCGLSQTSALGLRGIPVLTVREDEIAHLAVEGLANQVIADRLVISVRTVEAHLAHVYTKLGVAGRAELSAALKMAVTPGRSRGRGLRGEDSDIRGRCPRY